MMIIFPQSKRRIDKIREVSDGNLSIFDPYRRMLDHMVFLLKYVSMCIGKRYR